MKCSRPSSIYNGNHTNFHKEPYSLNEQIVYWCTNPRYFLWGEKSWVCRNSQGHGIWRAVSCSASEDCMFMASLKCLPLDLFNEECLRTRGTHARFNKDTASCSSGMCVPTSNSTCVHVFLLLTVQIHCCFIVTVFTVDVVNCESETRAEKKCMG